MHCLNTEEIQEVLLEMLLQLDRVLREHDVRYTLDGGTLLGAVRHKGFIPWDDDIDILVPRPDFSRLCNHPEWAPPGFRFAIPGKDGYELPFVKFFDLSWKAQEPGLEGYLDEYLWIDVFPADALPSDYHDRAELMKQQAKTAIKASRLSNNIDFAAKAAKNPIKSVAKRIILPIYRRMYTSKDEYEILARRAVSLTYGKTPEVGNVVWGPYKPGKPGFPVGDFDNPIGLEFEGFTFNACAHWNDYLTGLYGDYMTLPPVESRITHGMKVWRAD